MTALMKASQFGHLDVVNRLLNCKEIYVNLQSKVKWICELVSSIS